MGCVLSLGTVLFLCLKEDLKRTNINSAIIQAVVFATIGWDDTIEMDRQL